MEADKLLGQIADYCSRARMAESTFGRLAVNDGKLVSRLRIGGRITTTTAARVREFMDTHPAESAGQIASLLEHREARRRVFRRSLRAAE